LPTLTDPGFADVGPSHRFDDAIQWRSTGTAQPPGEPDDRPWVDIERPAMAAFLFRYGPLG
jgi:hypothetical protein